MTILVFACGAFNQGQSEVEVVRLGNPMVSDGKTDRALNVWDLQIFDGKLYVGGGDTNANAGPMNVWAYDLEQEKFTPEYKIPEEAILHFKVIDDELYIPAADPRGGDANKFYRQAKNGQWTKYADPSVKLAHVRDVIKLGKNKILVVGNGRPSTKNKIVQGAALTNDNGISFVQAGVNNTPDTGNIVWIDYNWFFSVFTYKNKVYAPNSFLRDTGSYPGSIAIYDPKIQELVIDFDLGTEEFIPEDNVDAKKGKHGVETIYQIWHPIEYRDCLVYTAKSLSNVDVNNSIKKLYLNSLGFYLKKAMGKPPVEVKLPHGAIGEDLLVINDELYVLANKKNGLNKFTTYVFKTSKPQNSENWTELFHFSNFNKSRSFEYSKETFYFGLGQDYGDPIANSGDILSYTLK